MVKLTRTQVGSFDLESALTLEELKVANEDGSLCEKLFPLEEALNFLPAIHVKKEYLESISHGVALSKSSLDVPPDQLKLGHYFRVLGNNDKILAVVEAAVNQDAFPSLSPEDIVFKAKRVLC
jgi:tRNA pseudouridine55 synthase